MPEFEQLNLTDRAGLEVAPHGSIACAPSREDPVFGAPDTVTQVDASQEETTKGWLWLPKSRIGKVVLAGVMAAATLLAAETVPQVPGHQETALLYELGESDAVAAFSGYQPPRSASALINDFGVGNGLFRGKSGVFSGYALLWPSNRALEAEYVASLVPGQSKEARVFENSREAVIEASLARQPDGQTALDPSLQAFDQETPPFVDDALWMADLEINSNDPAKVGVVSEVFDLAVSQWDANGGGDFWEVQLTDATNHIRAVVSNATAVRVGVWLYQQTGNSYYAHKSEEIFSWLQKTLRDGDLYYDHIDLDGSVDKHIYTYTLMDVAAAKAALSLVNPKKYPIQSAISQIQDNMRYIQEHHLYGNPAFDSIWATGGLWVASLYRHPAFTAEMRSSVLEAATTDSRKKHPTDLLDFSGELILNELEKVPESEYGRLF
jgi:hypothetical protein